MRHPLTEPPSPILERKRPKIGLDAATHGRQGALKTECLKRDGAKCVLTQWQDPGASAIGFAEEAQQDKTQLAHIVPVSAGTWANDKEVILHFQHLNSEGLTDY